MPLHNLFATLCLVLILPAADAETVTFEDVPIYSQGGFSNGGNFSSAGFQFELASSGGVVIDDGGYCNPQCPYNGSHYVLSPRQGGYLQMSAAGGAEFALDQFDATGSFGYAGFVPDDIKVTGQLAGGATVTETFRVDPLPPNTFNTLHFQTFKFDPTFQHLIGVRFESEGASSAAGFSIDNIAAVSVPEPSSLALMLLGLAGVVCSRRPKSSKAIESGSSK